MFKCKAWSPSGLLNPASPGLQSSPKQMGYTRQVQTQCELFDMPLFNAIVRAF